MSPTRTKNQGKPAALLKQHDCRTAIYDWHTMEEEIQREATEAATQLLTLMFTSAPPNCLLTPTIKTQQHRSQSCSRLPLTSRITLFSAVQLPSAFAYISCAAACARWSCPTAQQSAQGAITRRRDQHNTLKYRYCWTDSRAAAKCTKDTWRCATSWLTNFKVRISAQQFLLQTNVLQQQ
jgi:hypothetical protein